MANNRLILRKLTSPWSVFPDFTKNSVLKHEDLDNNFIYVKGELIYTAGIKNGNLVLQKINGDTINLPIPSGVTDTYITGGTYDNNTELITFTNNLDSDFTVDLSTIATGDVYVTGGTITGGTTLSLSRNDDVVVNVDLSSIVVTGTTVAFPGNQQEGSLSVSGDSQPTGIILLGTPIMGSRVDVIVNGVIYNVGDGVKTTDFYFSSNGGVTAKTLTTLIPGDELIFNGIISSIITLDVIDKININYNIIV